MNEGMELIPVQKLDPVEIFNNGGMDKILTGIKARTDEFVPDLSTASSRKEIASMAYKVSRSKTLLDDIGKTLVADKKKEIKKVDSIRKQARDFLDSLRDEIRQPLTDWEAEEKAKEDARIASVQAKLDKLRAVNTNPYDMTADALKEVIELIENTPTDPDEFFEFTVEANEIKTQKLKEACQALEDRERLDREEAERKAEAERLAEERKRQEEEAAKMRAEQEKLAAERRKIEEEKARIEAEKRAEQERKEREEFERKAKEEARIRAEKEAKEKAEREERERIEREKAEAAERKRQEQLRPDKEKLAAFAQFLEEGITYPTLKDKDARYFVDTIRDRIIEISEDIMERIEQL